MRDRSTINEEWGHQNQAAFYQQQPLSEVGVLEVEWSRKAQADHGVARDNSHGRDKLEELYLKRLSARQRLGQIQIIAEKLRQSAQQMHRTEQTQSEPPIPNEKPYNSANFAWNEARKTN